MDKSSFSPEQYNATARGRAPAEIITEDGQAYMAGASAVGQNIANTITGRWRKKRARRRDVDAPVDRLRTSLRPGHGWRHAGRNLSGAVTGSLHRPTMPQAASEKAAATKAQAVEDQSQEPPPEKKANLGRAASVVAKFDAPCKLCGNMLKIGDDILYVGDGPDKGRYCVEHSRLKGSPPGGLRKSATSRLVLPSQDPHVYNLKGRRLWSPSGTFLEVRYVNDKYYTEESRYRGQYVHRAIDLIDEGDPDIWKNSFSTPRRPSTSRFIEG